MGRLSAVLKLVALLATTVASVVAGAQNRDLTVDLEPAFTDFRAGTNRGLIPVRVTLRNSGPDAKGNLDVRSDSYEMLYPVDLPSGGVKRLTAYVPSAYYGEPVTFQLTTDRGWVTARFEVPFDPDSIRGSILCVGDTPGMMVFMRAGNSADPGAPPANPRDVYAVPGSLPDRATGFWTIRAVVLGEGAERLTDAEVKALKTWVVAGGTLVMIGGASSPVLADPRWAEFAPIRNARAATVPPSVVLGKLGRAPVPPEPMAVMKGTAAPGCRVTVDRGLPLVVRRPVGLGKVVFFAFNPFETPLRRWPGRAKLFTTETEPSFGGTAFQPVANRQDGSAPYYAGPGMGPGQEYSDPFSVRLPPAYVVVWILLAYLVVVVPLNLIVLRKIGRSEWAWGTTPLISLGFAAIFFQFAGSLYSSGMAVANDGLLVMDTRFDTGLYVGKSQIFFPRGGRYDLGLTGTEAAYTGGMEQQMYYDGSRKSVPLNASDDGEVRIEDVRVGNLSFMELDLVQRVPVGSWFDANLKVQSGSSPRRLTGTITNRSRYTVSGLIRCGKYQAPLNGLAAGATMNLDELAMIQAVPLSGDEWRSSSQNAREIDLTRGDPERVLLDGVIVGFTPGPQMGSKANARQSIRIVAVLGEVEVPQR